MGKRCQGDYVHLNEFVDSLGLVRRISLILLFSYLLFLLSTDIKCSVSLFQHIFLLEMHEAVLFFLLNLNEGLYLGLVPSVSYGRTLLYY